MSSLLKNLLFALGLAVILWLGYNTFLKEDEEPLVEGTNSSSAGQAEREAQEFLSRLQSLKRIDIDGDIFNDSRFTSLVSLRQELGEEESGRENPFAPVE